MNETSDGPVPTPLDGPLAVRHRSFAFVDQAGVGEALGPLIVVALYTDTLNLPPVKDSKKARKKDWQVLQGLLGEGIASYRYVSYPPAVIDRYSVKALITAAQESLLAGFQGRAYVDCHTTPGHLRAVLGLGVVTGHGLDQSVPGVALASLVAYRLRVKALQGLESRVGRRVGSGNLSDPVTRAYLRQGGTEGLRRKWSLASLSRIQKKKTGV